MISSAILSVILVVWISFTYLNPINTLFLTIFRHIQMYLLAITFGIGVSYAYLSYTNKSIDKVMFVVLVIMLSITALVYYNPNMIMILKLGPILMLTLYLVFFAMIINLFIRSSPMQYIISLVAVVLFVFLLMYDTKLILLQSKGCIDYKHIIDPNNSKFKPIIENYTRTKKMELYKNLNQSGIISRPNYIYHGLSLFLDLLNLFWYLLYLVGVGKN